MFTAGEEETQSSKRTAAVNNCILRETPVTERHRERERDRVTEREKDSDRERERERDRKSEREILS